MGQQQIKNIQQLKKKKKKKTKENTRVRKKEIIKPQKETEKDKGTKRKQNRLGNKV